jgi:hypothetical protein
MTIPLLHVSSLKDRDVRESLPVGRCVPKLENPIMERIMESESSSDIFGGGMSGVSVGYELWEGM